MKLLGVIVLGGLMALGCSGAILPEPLSQVEENPISGVLFKTPATGWSEAKTQVCRDILAFKGTSFSGLEITIELQEGMAKEEYKLEYNDNQFKVIASTARGIYYGVATIRQMVGFGDGEVGCGVISDKPYWEHRYVSDGLDRATRENFIDLAANKISGVGLRAEGMWRDDDFTTRFAKELAVLREVEELDIADVMIQMHMMEKKPHSAINFGKEEDIVKTIEASRLFAEHGVDWLMVAVDDLTPREGAKYIFINQEEKDKFQDSVGAAHGYIMKRIYEELHGEFPQFEMGMCVAPYGLVGHGIHTPEVQQYFIDWAKNAPDEVYVVWTGNYVFAPVVTQEDIDNLQYWVPNHPVMMFSNSNGVGGYMALWESDYVPSLREVSNGNMFLLSTFSFWPLERLYVLTANDYLWQEPGKYDAKRSYYAATELEHGAETSEALYNLQRAYLSCLGAITTGDRALTKPYFDDFKIALEVAEKVMEQNGKPILLSRVREQFEHFESIMNFELKSITISSEPTTIELQNRSEDMSKDMPTTMSIAYDGENLVLVFDVTNPAPITQAKLPYDSTIFGSDDVLEILIQPAPQSNEWLYSEIQGNSSFHFCVDVAGNRFDEQGVGGGYSFDSANWSADVEPTETGWSATIKIPVDELKHKLIKYVSPEESGMWKGNFHRVNNQAGIVQSWEIAGKSFHGPEYLGEIYFAKEVE